MTPFEIGLISLVIIVALIYLGMDVPVVLASVSFFGIWFVRGSIDPAINLLSLAASTSLAEYVFGVIPLFVLMGLLVSTADLGKDSYEVAHYSFRKVSGGLGIATVVANAIFAAITGSSIASAAVFSRVSVPEMLKFNYERRFAVGVVAGSSVLGMLIPPSVLLIVYALLAEVSVGAMFLAGILPGLLLTLAYSLMIVAMAVLRPSYVGGSSGKLTATMAADQMTMSPWTITRKMFPVVLLVVIVMGGIYGGLFTPTEAGAAGALATFVVALAKRKLSLQKMWELLVETGHITASILFLIIASNMYSRMLAISGLPTQIGQIASEMNANLYILLAIFVVALLILGTIMDSISIMLVTVPLFLPLLAPYGVSLIWFGIVTVLATEIGLLTPPLGIACYVIHSALKDFDFTLGDVFAGALPFAAIMLLVLIIVIAFPQLSLFFL